MRLRRAPTEHSKLSYASWALVLSLMTLSVSAIARETDTLPTPLELPYVIAFAREHRQEIVAANASVRAAEQRPTIVSTLDEPMVMPSVDHLPFMLHGVDVSLMVEQRFPLSNVLSSRKSAAEASAQGFRAKSATVAQDVSLDAARAFLMLRERRQMASVLTEQVALAREFVVAAGIRYATGTGSQPEVFRAEVEVARLESIVGSIIAEISGAEAMLNASLGRPVDSMVPTLGAVPVDSAPPTWSEVQDVALRNRPELDVGRAELTRAQAEIAVMESMYLPMAFVRTGPSYTMADGWGWMLTAGISVPIWQQKYDAGVREAHAMADMARSDLAAMARMIEGEAAAARSQVLAARRRLLALRDDVLPRARQAIDPSFAAYAAGTLPLVSVIDAARALWSLEAELISAEFELGLAWAKLQRAQARFGTGSEK